MAATTFNPSDKNANITLSSGNLVATASGADGDKMVRSTNSVLVSSAAKLYFEAKQTVNGSTFHPELGFDNGTTSLSSFPGSTGSGGIGYGAQGGVTYNGSLLTTIQSCAINDVTGVAIDLGAKKIWFKNITAASGWNNAAIGSQNPATGTGGISFSTLTGTSVLAACSVYHAADAWSVTFASTNFVGTMPSGFTTWNASDAPVVAPAFLQSVVSMSLGVNVSGLSAFFPISSVVSLTQSNLVSTGPSNTQLTSEDFQSLVTDSDVQLLTADVPGLSIGQLTSVANAQTFAVHGLATFETITASVSAGAALSAIGSSNCFPITSVASLGQSNSVSATDTFDVLVSSSILLNRFPASAVDTIESISCVSSMASFINASSTNTIEVISATASLTSNTNSSSTNTIEVISATANLTSNTNASSIDTIEVISPIVSMHSFTNASSTDTLEVISSAATATSSTSASTIDTIEVITAVSSMHSFTNASSTDTLEVISATASLTSNTNASGISTIELLASVVATAEFTDAQATNSLEIITSVVSLGQSDPVNATNTIEALVSVSTGQLPYPAAATDSFFNLQSVVSLGQSDGVNSTNTIEVLASAGTAFNPWVHGTGALEILTCASAAGQSDLISATNTIEALTCVSVAQNAWVTGTSTLEALTAVVAAGQSDLASSVQTIEVLTSAGIAFNPWMHATNTFAVINGTGFAGAGLIVHATNSFFPISAIASMASSTNASAVDSVEVLTSSAFISDWAVASNTIEVLVPAVSLGQSDAASARDTIEALTCVSSAQQFDQCSAANTIELLSCLGKISDWAFGLSTLFTITAIGAESVGTNASAKNTIEQIVSVTQLGQSNPVQALDSFAAIGVAATASMPLGATEIASIEVLSAQGTATQQDQAAAADSFLGITCQAQVGQGAQAAGLATVNFTANGILRVPLAATAVANIDLESVVSTRSDFVVFASAVANFMALSAQGTAKHFAVGLSRQVFFDTDDRLVYWSPSTPSSKPGGGLLAWKG